MFVLRLQTRQIPPYFVSQKAGVRLFGAGRWRPWETPSEQLWQECGQRFLMEVTVMSEADEMRLDCVCEALMVALFYGSCFTAPWSGAKLVP